MSTPETETATETATVAATLSTHVLNLDAGAPASNLIITLHTIDTEGNRIDLLGQAVTNEDGRAADWPKLNEGNYELCFLVSDWYDQQSLSSFYPRVRIEFRVDSSRHYHVPLLLNRFGFSSYRGS